MSFSASLRKAAKNTFRRTDLPRDRTRGFSLFPGKLRILRERLKIPGKCVIVYP